MTLYQVPPDVTGELTPSLPPSRTDCLEADALTDRAKERESYDQQPAPPLGRQNQPYQKADGEHCQENDHGVADCTVWGMP